MRTTTSFSDAIERLEWDERKEDETPFKRWRQFTRRTALTGGAAGIAALILEACGSSSSSSSLDGDGRQRRQLGRGLDLRLEPGLQVHARQPRDDQPVLHADPERRRRRLQAARLLVPVDRVADEQRLRDGQRDEQRGQRRRQRDRASRSSTCTRSTARRKRRSGRASRSSPTTPTRRRTRGSRTSVRTCTSPASRWASTSRRSCRPVTWRCSSRRPARSTSSRGSTARMDTLKSHPSDHAARGRDRRGDPGRAVGDRLLRDRPSEHEGHVRGRRRQHPGRRADDPEARA